MTGLHCGGVSHRREPIEAGLDGDREEGERAREVLRNAVLFGGEIKLVPEDRALYAEFALQPPAMLPTVQAIRVGNQGFRVLPD